jgi:hypothetical protein
LFENPAFRKRALAVLILGTFMMYFYSGLQNDHLNVLTAYYQSLGWNATTITNPVTIAGFIIILATPIVGTLMIKYGVTRVMVPSTIILALATIGLAFSGTNLLMYSISLFLVRLFVLPLQMGAFMLCTNWFIDFRGRALGLITVGNPLCTATLIASLTAGVATLGFTWTYTIVGIIVLVLAFLIGIFIKSTPEECGLYPDGAAHPPRIAEDTKTMTLKEVFANNGSYLLIISFGFLQFCIVAIMAFFVPRMNMTGTDMSVTLTWLSIAAICAMPVSYILGVIDDKFGTVTASLILCLTYLLALISLLKMTANNIPLLALAAFGIAGVTGGTPNLHPSITAYVYGRQNYQAANRWIMAIQAIIMAFAIYFMSAILDATGSLDLAYEIMIVMVIIATVRGGTTLCRNMLPGLTWAELR